MDLDRRTHKRLQQTERTNYPIAMSSTLKLEQRKKANNRRKCKRIGGNTVAKTKRRKFKSGRICKQIFIDH